MRELTALIKEFENQDELVSLSAPVAGEAFLVPNRNWEILIDNYNFSNAKKFCFTSLQCKVIIEYVKKGIPIKSIWKSLGISHQMYTHLVNTCTKLEDELYELISKNERSTEDYEKCQKILRDPVRLLISDIERAKGISEINDWERYNEMAYLNDIVMTTKMKAKFKDFFSDRQAETGSTTVTINLGRDLVSGL